MKRKPNGYWTKEKCKEKALKYKSRKIFNKECGSIITISIKNGWLDEICSHMPYERKNKWTLEECRKVAQNYETRTELSKNNSGCYAAAQSNGWLDDICSHMVRVIKEKNYWTKEKCKEEALKYKNRTEFSKKSASAYVISINKGWIDDICSHMIAIGNKYKRCIYAYEFPDNHVYVGLTYNIEIRNTRHFNKGPVLNHYKETNLKPKLLKLTEYLNLEDAKKMEKEYLNKYIRNNWNILNSNKTGQLGNTTIKWSKSKCQKEILKYKTISDFNKYARGAYNSANKNGWLEEIWKNKFIIMENKKKTINIDAELHKKLSTYCKSNKLKINEYVNGLIEDHLSFTLKEKSVLPLVLKDSKGEIVETIICNEISPEYKNSLPKSITLIRSTKDGTGFVANYYQK